jgi:hypothetical protein
MYLIPFYEQIVNLFHLIQWYLIKLNSFALLKILYITTV